MLNRIETAVVRESVIVREYRTLIAQGAKRKGTVYHPERGHIIGFNFGTSVRPDVSRITVNAGDQSAGACYDENCSVKVFDHEMGTIIIDVVDGHTNRLIWRGWAQNPVAGVLNNPTRFQANIQKAVTRMFAKFPRAL